MKKFLVFLLSLTICLTPSLTFAGLSSSGWMLQNPIVKGASVAYEGVKNVIINGKNVAKKSTALITPTATQVAKVLVRGGAAYALSVAVQEILGAVDWVMDAENNQIVYYVDNPDNYQYLYKNTSGRATKSWGTAEEACLDYIPASSGSYLYKFEFAVTEGNKGCYYRSKPKSNPNAEWGITQLQFGFTKTANPDYDPTIEREKKTVPLETVAQKVISNAESSSDQNKKAGAQEATTAAAKTIVEEAQNDDAKAKPIVNQLEANSKTETDADAGNATGETKPNTTTGGSDLSLTFPVFCSWAPQVCEAAQTVISFPTTLTDWWNESKQKTDSWAKSISDAYASTKEWFQKEPDKDNSDNDVPVKTPEAFDNSVFSKDRFAVSRQCPIPEQHTITLSGVSVNFSFDMTPLCEVLILARPALVACSYLYAAYIVIGAARNG